MVWKDEAWATWVNGNVFETSFSSLHVGPGQGVILLEAKKMESEKL
jgi:hypothetical protein